MSRAGQGWRSLDRASLSESWGFGVAAGLLLAGVFLTVFFFRLGDFDCWWHLATGRLIFQERAIPSVDPFSWTIGGHPWLDFEWLSQLVLYGFHSAGGLGGLLFYKALLATMLFATLLAYGRWSRTPAFILFPALLLGFMVMRQYLVERPQLFTFWFTASVWVMIERHRHGCGGIWLMPAMFMLWANLHGGACLIGFVLPVLLLAWRLAALLPSFPLLALDPPLDRRGCQRLLVATVLSAGATLLNPHGFRIYMHALATVSDPGSRTIAEWLPPRPGDYAGTLGAFLSLTALAALLARRRDPVRWLMVAILVAMACSACRHIPLMTIVALCAVVAAYPGAPAGARKPARPPRWPLAPTLALWLLVPACLLLFLRFDKFRERIGWGTVELPKGAADFVLKERLKGRLFNTYDFGGYLIWRLWPDWKVFIDGRNLEYGPELVILVSRWHEAANWKLIEQRYAPDLAIVGQGEGYQCRVFDEDPAWALLHWDDTSLLYARVGRGNDAVIARSRYRLLRPNAADFSYLTAHLAEPSTRDGLLAELGRGDGLNASLMRGTVFKELGRWPEAIAAFETAHRLKDEAAQPCSSLGIVYQRMGDPAHAREWYLAALDRSPDDALTWSNLGVLDFGRGDLAAARRAWVRALSIDPHCESARANLQQVQTSR